ncbi:MAG: PD-(D/E)XK nuclease-like domain-containing protein [Alphaproteobacteria bacterium]
MRPLPPDGVIRESGQYSISMDVYHGQPCNGPSISSTGLRKIYLESPADFWARSDLNDDRFDSEQHDHFVFGRAAHALLLGDEDFNAQFAVVPASAPPKPTSAQIKARLAGRVSDAAQERFGFWDDFSEMNEGKSLLQEEDLHSIMYIKRALEAHPIVPVLLEGQAEQSLIWQDQDTGVWLKSRLDMLSSTGDLADLKTTSQKRLDLLLRDVRQHGYDMQLGLATMALEEVLGVPFTPEAYEARAAILLFVYKEPPFHVIPIQIDYDALYWARLKVRKAIDTFAECIKSGVWPGPVEGIPIYTADYEATQLAEKQRDGKLPMFA